LSKESNQLIKEARSSQEKSDSSSESSSVNVLAKYDSSLEAVPDFDASNKTSEQ